MQDEMITPENLSKELLKSVFDSALLDAAINSDGELSVKEQLTCFVFISERKDRIILIARFGFKPNVPRLQRLECVNKINDEYIMVRAVVGDQYDILRFSYDIFVGAGISKKNVVLALKRFCSIPHDAVAEYGKEIVE